MAAGCRVQIMERQQSRRQGLAMALLLLLSLQLTAADTVVHE
jgi:hypothetical protein